jgi:hypothetical protein
MHALGVKLAFDTDRADLTGIAHPSNPRERIADRPLAVL